MTDLKIESVDHLQRGSVNIYAANCGEDRRIIAESLYAFEKYDAVETMVAELHDRPEFCQLAAAVHGLHLAKSGDTPTTEAIAILTKLRDSRQPEAIRTRAGNLLIDIAASDRAVRDASSVDDRPGQDAGAALETIGAIRTVWWEGGVFSQTDKRTGVLEKVETEGRICSVYTIVDAEGQRWMGNNIKFSEVTP